MYILFWTSAFSSGFKQFIAPLLVCLFVCCCCILFSSKQFIASLLARIGCVQRTYYLQPTYFDFYIHLISIYVPKIYPHQRIGILTLCVYFSLVYLLLSATTCYTFRLFHPRYFSSCLTLLTFAAVLWHALSILRIFALGTNVSLEPSGCFGIRIFARQLQSASISPPSLHTFYGCSSCMRFSRQVPQLTSREGRGTWLGFLHCKISTQMISISFLSPCLSVPEISSITVPQNRADNETCGMVVTDWSLCEHFDLLLNVILCMWGTFRFSYLSQDVEMFLSPSSRKKCILLCSVKTKHSFVAAAASKENIFSFIGTGESTF